MEINDQMQNQVNNPPNSRIVKRMLDINFVLEQSKKRFEAQPNPRLMERNHSVMKLTAYDSFSPFKRGH